METRGPSGERVNRDASNGNDPDFSGLLPRIDRILWVALVGLVAVAAAAWIGPAGVVAASAAVAVVLVMTVGAARAHGARAATTEHGLVERSRELEVQASELQREGARSRTLADYLKAANDELREQVESLSRARALTRTAAEEREHSLATLDVVLASAPVGIAILDKDLFFERVNPAYARFDGLSGVEHVGRNARDVSPSTAPALVPVLVDVLATDTPRVGVEIAGAASDENDNQTLWLVNVYPLRGADGSPRGLGVIAVDNTERNALERQLIHSQKMEALGRLAGSLAHDFNNLLTAISAFAQFALEGTPPDSPVREDIGQIVLATERGSVLTRRLLTFSLRQMRQPRPLDVNRIVRELEGLLRRLVGEDVALATRLADPLWAVDADPGQIEQVILNLAINARDAMPNGGSLTIETRNVELDVEHVRLYPDAKEGPHVMLAVTDTGTGMDSATQAHAFEPFFTTKPVGKGTGLGLSTTKGIVKQSGGSIWMYSEPGRGTSIKVFLPRSTNAPAAAEPRASVAEKASLAPASVLVVEDDPSVRLAVHRVLEGRGCTVHDADNGREALETLERLGGWVDLVVTDLVMPEMGGIEFSREVRERSPETRLVFMSGYAADTAQQQELRERGALFLEKPFTADTLVATVHRALGSGSRGDAAA